MTTRSESSVGTLLSNIAAGLTVSFVAISLGAAFGILSERGAFAGIISAGIIALVTAAFGGTRVQCSGPTAPMTAVTAVVVAFAHDEMLRQIPGANPDHFINIVLILTGVVLLLAAVLRLGRFISLVPNVVISGFMDGIAILIWLDQLRKLFGFGGKAPFGGTPVLNLLLAATTVALIFVIPWVMRVFSPKLAHFLPATLLTIVLLTITTALFGLNVELVALSTTINSAGDLVELLRVQFPREWTAPIIWLAVPFALQLSMLCYLDTLLTSLVVDRLSGETTRRDKELAAQGIANGIVAFLGGIPGAQATIRSVLILKENATLRWAGVLVGVFVMVEMLLFQNLISQIPQAVFAGILIKVGYDVFDWTPLKIYARELSKRTIGWKFFVEDLSSPGIFVGHWEIVFITGTALVTVLWDLNIAVIMFALLFYLVRRHIPMNDLTMDTETDSVSREP